jgi:hypothetical protein
VGHPCKSLYIDIDRWLRLFHNVKMKALVQSVRFHVFSILDNVISRHREGMLPSFIRRNTC